MKLAANLNRLFTDYKLADRFDAARKAGFTAVEISSPYDWPADELASRLDALGLHLVHFYCPRASGPDQLGLACLPGRRDDFRRSLEQGLAFASVLATASVLDTASRQGRPILGIHQGNIPPGADRAPYLDMLAENLAWAADTARSSGLTLVIEPVSRARAPDFALHRVSECAALLATLGKPNLKLVFDTFHVWVERDPIIPTMLAHWDHIGHIQIGNPPGRHEPGNGELDLPFILRAAAEHGWDGFVSCEYDPSTTRTTDSLGWARAYGVSEHTEAR